MDGQKRDDAPGGFSIVSLFVARLGNDLWLFLLTYLTLWVGGESDDSAITCTLTRTIHSILTFYDLQYAILNNLIQGLSSALTLQALSHLRIRWEICGHYPPAKSPRTGPRASVTALVLQAFCT